MGRGSTTRVIGIRWHLRAATWILTIFAVSAPAAALAQYRLGAQDRVRILVHEWPALTGEFTVGADDRVALPIIGEIDVSGMPPSELAGEISRRLKSKGGLVGEPDTAVNIVQYRPVYVVGGVERAGEYAYRPGMMVLNAVSIAGGAYRRPESTGWDVMRETLAARGDLRLRGVRQQELSAREIRLKAEVRRDEVLGAVPPGTARDVVPYLKEEQTIFTAHRDKLRNELGLLKETIKLYEEEIATLRGQREAAEKQRFSMTRELSEVRDLVSRGLAPTPRVLPLERSIAQVEREQKEIDTQITRARGQISATERLITTARDDQVSVAARDLLAVQAQIREEAQRYAAAETLAREATAFSSELSAKTDADERVELAFTIVRADNGEAKEIPAAETTSMQPGDILKVRLVRQAPHPVPRLFLGRGPALSMSEDR